MSPDLDSPATLIERLGLFLTQEAGPLLQMDGVRIEVLSIQNQVARVRLSQGCWSCPASILPVIMELETLIRKQFREIDYLEFCP